MKNYPAVLSFEKKIIPSSGYFFATNWDDRNKSEVTLKVETKTVRGTKSNKGEKKPEDANIQTVDYCSLPVDKDTLKLSFTVKFIGELAEPSACDNQEFLSGYKKLIDNYSHKAAFKELALRYATNLTNGRYLWRNRVGTENIEVQVFEQVNNENTLLGTVAKNDMQYRSFEANTNVLTDTLAKKIENVFSGKREYLLLEVVAFVQIGKGQEVYPSEEFVQSKEEKGSDKEGKKSKELYQTDGIAALHSQKIGNAIRTIDTWYDDYSETNRIIAIEPFGSVTTRKNAYRNSDTKKDFYTLFESFIEKGELESSDDEHFVIANLIRGGVFGAKA